MLDGLPVQMSVVDIHVIGAGGDSLAWEEADGDMMPNRDASAAVLAKLGKTVEMANIHLAAIAHIPGPDNAVPLPQDAALERSRSVSFNGKAQPTRIVDRNALAAGMPLSSPAIIEEGATTTQFDRHTAVIGGSHMALCKGASSAASLTQSPPNLSATM